MCLCAVASSHEQLWGAERVELRAGRDAIPAGQFPPAGCYCWSYGEGVLAPPQRTRSGNLFTLMCLDKREMLKNISVKPLNAEQRGACEAASQNPVKVFSPGRD